MEFLEGLRCVLPGDGLEDYKILKMYSLAEYFWRSSVEKWRLTLCSSRMCSLEFSDIVHFARYDDPNAVARCVVRRNFSTGEGV